MKVELIQVGQEIANKVVLKNVNLKMESGEFVCISGGSGEGKSLLFSAVCGVLKQQQGEILYDGFSLEQMSEQQERAFRAQLGVVFQRAALISNLTVNENLMLPLNLHAESLTMDEKTDRVEVIAAKLGLSRFLHLRPDKLSTGQGVLAGLARAVINQPKLFVWDAPLVDTDTQWSSKVTAVLSELKANGSSVIIFTNRADIIEQLADRHFEIYQGQIGLVNDQ